MEVDRETGTIGFNVLARKTDPELLRRKLKHYFAQAHARVGESFVARATETILTDKPFEKNSGLTVVIKGSSTPLFQHGDLVGSLTWQPIGTAGTKIRVGVNSEKLADGDQRWLAEVLHNGATVRVTDAMRARVFALARESPRWAAFERQLVAAPPKAVWIIPPRPFIAVVLESRTWLSEIRAIYQAAFDAALR